MKEVKDKVNFSSLTVQKGRKGMDGEKKMIHRKNMRVRETI